MATRWTKDQIDFLKENYGIISDEEISQKLNKTISSIKHKVSREGIESPKTWTEEELQYLRDNYKTKTYKELAKELGRSKAAIDLKINRMGLVKSKYEYDHSFFKDIQTEAQAYWCGFIMADGCVSTNEEINSCEICIKLQAGDADHLRKFNKSIKGNVPVTLFDDWIVRPGETEETISHQCQIRLYSQEMFHDLEKYGVIPNKSLIKQFPKNIPDNLMNHFIRGYFDGNGSISFKENKYRSCSFCTGSEIFANDMSNYINEKVCKTSKIYKSKRANCFSFNVSSYDSTYAFLNYLYKDATIYLDRKFQKKEQFLNSEGLKRYLLRQSEMVG